MEIGKELRKCLCTWANTLCFFGRKVALSRFYKKTRPAAEPKDFDASFGAKAPGLLMFEIDLAYGSLKFQT